MKRLLLVEDDRSLGATLHERLLREKYDVAWVETKQSALAKLNEGLWDLVILDIGLPDGSGFELARHIKSNAAMPVMFETWPVMNTFPGAVGAVCARFTLFDTE